MRQMRIGKKIVLGLVIMEVIVSLLCFPAYAKEKIEFQEAEYYLPLTDKNVQCLLCPRECILEPGQRGTCRARENIDGHLYSLVYRKVVSWNADPIEKKPLYHVLPGTKSFSLATAGCNLGCLFCQNWTISQVKPEDLDFLDFSPQKVVDMALESYSRSIAYTYSEPTIFYEYMRDIARLAKQKGLVNIYRTAGYINPEPLQELCRYLDATNCDLKGYSDTFYRQYCLGKLSPVLESLKIMQKEKVWIEITNLIIPTVNDDFKMIRQMCRWIKENLGSEVPLHFSRFFPAYRMTHLPPTPVETLEKAREIALAEGIKYVYIGNIPGHPAQNTYCPRCKRIVIERAGYYVAQNNLKEGKCKFCGQKIPGIWKFPEK